MQPERRNQISNLFHAALERAPEERQAFLEQACDGDRALRQEIESLLRHDSEGAAFLETPVMKAAGGEASRAGQQLGPYRILGPLGAGGMGEVYRARDSKLGREVAIKMLPPLFTADPERRARFAREARLLATLNHPHIGAIYGLEDLEGQTALVLELVEGPTLAKRLEGGPLPIGEALAVARQIADALDAAHQKNIVHRDLKPANVVLQEGTSSDRRVKVLDFGLATTGIGDHAIDAQQVSMTLERTEPGRILGTPAYMSPEQARGQVVDKRTDIWAFGCVLFEMLTGHSPFRGDTVSDTLAHILEREPQWASLPQETPASIRALLRRCLRKDPEKRLHDIADARIEIDDRGLVDQSTEPTRHHGAVRQLTWAAALLGLVALVSLSTVGWLLRRPATPVPSATPAEPVAFSFAPPPGLTFGNRSVIFAISPDGRQIVFSASSGPRSSLWVRPVGAEESTEIPGTEGATFPFWKPDSTEIGFFAKDRLWTVAPAGGVPFEVCPAPQGVGLQGGATWNRDDLMLFMAGGFTLHKVPAKGGAPAAALELAQGETAHRWPWFLPDGDHFLYLAFGPPGTPRQLRVGSLDGSSTLLGPSDSNAVYSGGYLLSLSGGQLGAQPFDLATRRAVGKGLPVASLAKLAGITVGPDGYALMSVSSSGVLATSRGIFQRNFRLTWRDRIGTPISSVGELGILSNLDLNHDESRVAVAGIMDPRQSWDIWIVDLVRGTSEPVTSDPDMEFDPSWSPDETRIGFISTRIPGHYGAYSRASDGSGKDEPLMESESSAYLTFWSRLGLGYNQGGDLWIRPVDGAARPVIGRTEAIEDSGTLSPDEHAIAFESNKSGRREVYVRAFPSGDREQRVSNDGGAVPRWSGDSKEIFFLAPDSTLMAAHIDGGRWSNPEKLFRTDLTPGLQKAYAVRRDGKRFLMPMTSGPAVAPTISVIVNWQSRLPK